MIASNYYKIKWPSEENGSHGHHKSEGHVFFWHVLHFKSLQMLLITCHPAWKWMVPAEGTQEFVSKHITHILCDFFSPPPNRWPNGRFNKLLSVIQHVCFLLPFTNMRKADNSPTFLCPTSSSQSYNIDVCLNSQDTQMVQARFTVCLWFPGKQMMLQQCGSLLLLWLWSPSLLSQFCKPMLYGDGQLLKQPGKFHAYLQIDEFMPRYNTN